MQTRFLKTTHQSIKGQISSVKPEQALAEYIWNGFDADATKVEINTQQNELDVLTSITVQDNGDGIDYDEIESTLDLFLDSKKKRISKPTTRGKRGRGRFTFVKFCEEAFWETSSGKNGFSFKIDSGYLHRYEPKKFKNDNLTQKGTKVSFSHIKEIDLKIFNNHFIPFLKNEFTWLLISNPKLKLVINGTPLSLPKYESILHKEDFGKEYFSLNSVIWNEKPNQEKSLIYFIDSTNSVVHKELSELNLKGFYCSSYVSSDWFNGFTAKPDLFLDGNSPESKVFSNILSLARNKLRQEYINFRNSAAESLIQQYIKEGVFPQMNGDNRVLHEFHRSQLISTVKIIYEAEPAVFSKQLNKSQKRILIKLLDRIVQSNRLSELFDVLDGVVSLSEDDMGRISGLLQRTSLENITKTVEHVRDRLDIIQNFKVLIKDHKKFALEVPHIQKCIESNLWLFGEKYHLLTSEEDKFDQALRSLLSFKSKSTHYDKKPLTHPDKNREMDLFIAQKGFKVGDDDKKYFHHVVIELKRPSIKLGDAELEQIKRYKNVISNESQFHDENSVWDFVLIGNEISSSTVTAANLRSDLESNKIHGETGLVQKTGNYRIIVKTWKQILNEFELRYNEISNRLNLKELELVSNTPNDLTKDILNTSNGACLELA